MQVDKTRVERSGEGFQITFINGICLKGIPITAEDGMGRVLSVPITNEPGDLAPPTP